MATRPDHPLERFWSTTRVDGASQELTSDQQDELRAHQIGAIITLAPVMMAANLVNTLIIDLLFWNAGHGVFLIGWTTAVCGIVAIWGENWRRATRREGRLRASPRGVRRVTMNALLFGVVWTTPFMVMFPDVSEAQRVVLATCAAGMISGGALALATVWQAALVYSMTIEIPTALVLVATGDPMYIGLAALSASFGGLIARTVHERGRLFIDSFVANLSLRDQGQTIGLLLRDFEENSSDWLFEVDAAGRLARVSARLASVLGKTAEDLDKAPVETLLAGPPLSGDPRTAAALRRLGRSFRLGKPFRDVLLPVTIGGEERWWTLTGRPVYDDNGAFQGYRGVGSDITDAKQAEASIARMTSYDMLTGLPNRALLHLRLAHALKRTDREGRRLAILSLDLDRFKTVNDTLGHQTGDHLLVEVANRISGLLRDADIVARFGGDEFVILRTNMKDKSDADGLAGRLIETVSAPYEIDGNRILVGASVGVAFAPDDGEDARDLLRNSDLALFCAKSEGKGCFRHFSRDMSAARQSRRLMEIELREALETNRLEVFFQPLVEVTSGQISACEALVRWNHPLRGYVSPAEFIPLAEETGLVVPIGEFVLRQACAEAASWTRDLRVAVNLSAVQFRSGDIAALVSSVLAETGLRPDRLELEITESILIEEKAGVLRTLTALRAVGARIALDDFGTGYSSLAYLSSFPFDKIKIDRSFVRDVAQRPDAAAIIRAIMSLATTLGMCTTAEGVENIEELDWLRAQGCGEVQGYLFSVPVPARDLKLLLGMNAPAKTGPARAA